MNFIPINKAAIDTLDQLAKPDDRRSAPPDPSAKPPAIPPPKSYFSKPVLGVLAILVIAAVAFMMWRASANGSQQSAQGAEFATVKRGDFVHTLRVQGTVEAVSFVSIAAPRLTGPGLNSLIVTKLTLSGNKVKKGDLLVEFDRQTQIKNALDRQAEFVDLEQQIRKKQADQSALRAADTTALKQAESTMQSASLELKRNEIVSRIDAEKNEQNFQEAKATFEQLRATFDLKRKADKAEIRSLEIQRDRASNAMEYAKTNTGRLEIHSPIDGIVVLNSIWKGGQMGEVQEGDEVRAGVPFMQVVNAGSMQVRSRVNQADASSLDVDMPVKVGLDAYPELSFKGKIERKAAIGVTSGLSSKVRTFQILFSLDGTDSKLMPDLSASVDVEIEKVPSVLVVPRDSVVTENKEDFVFVAGLGRPEKRKVVIKKTSDTEVVVESGVDEGARVMRNAKL